MVEDPSAKTSFFQDEKRLFHRRQGVPLKGPFLALFSQGNLSKVNEIVHFSDFRIFCSFDPASLGYLSLIHAIMEEFYFER